MVSSLYDMEQCQAACTWSYFSVSSLTPHFTKNRKLLCLHSCRAMITAIALQMAFLSCALLKSNRLETLCSTCLMLSSLQSPRTFKTTQATQADQSQLLSSECGVSVAALVLTCSIFEEAHSIYMAKL